MGKDVSGFFVVAVVVVFIFFLHLAFHPARHPESSTYTFPCLPFSICSYSTQTCISFTFIAVKVKCLRYHLSGDHFMLFTEYKQITPSAFYLLHSCTLQASWLSHSLPLIWSIVVDDAERGRFISCFHRQIHPPYTANCIEKCVL